MRKGFSGSLCGIALLASALLIGCSVKVYSDKPVCVVPAPEFVIVENDGLETIPVDGVLLRPGERMDVNIAPDVVVCDVPSYEADLNDFVIGLEPLDVEVVGGVVIIL